MSSEEDSFAGVGILAAIGDSGIFGETGSWGVKKEVKRDLTAVFVSGRAFPKISCSGLLLALGAPQRPKNLSTPFSTTAGAVAGSVLC